MRGGVYSGDYGRGITGRNSWSYRSGKDAEVGVVVDDAWGAKGAIVCPLRLVRAALRPVGRTLRLIGQPSGRLSLTRSGRREIPDQCQGLRSSGYSSRSIRNKHPTPTPNPGTPTARASRHGGRGREQFTTENTESTETDWEEGRQRDISPRRGGGCGEKLMGERAASIAPRRLTRTRRKAERQRNTRAERGQRARTAHSDAPGDLPTVPQRRLARRCPLCSRRVIRCFSRTRREFPHGGLSARSTSRDADARVPARGRTAAGPAADFLINNLISGTTAIELLSRSSGGRPRSVQKQAAAAGDATEMRPALTYEAAARD